MKYMYNSKFNSRLIFLCFIMHAFNLGLVVYYIRKRFKPKRSKTVEPKAGATGTEMLF